MGCMVIVCINDCGFYICNWVIDLSWGVVEVLGMVGLGFKLVELFVL